MRRILLIGFLVLTGAGALMAQTFPLTVKTYWNPNPATDSVTGYTLIVDGGSPVAIGPVATNDSNCLIAQYPTGCIIAPIAILVAGQHTFVVTATNQWGTSAPSTLIVNINSPGQIIWIKVAK
jgi:hypothetical protein